VPYCHGRAQHTLDRKGDRPASQPGSYRECCKGSILHSCDYHDSGVGVKTQMNTIAYEAAIAAADLLDSDQDTTLDGEELLTFAGREP
jgi:hypothetical protein